MVNKVYKYYSMRKKEQRRVRKAERKAKRALEIALNDKNRPTVVAKSAADMNLDHKLFLEKDIPSSNIEALRSTLPADLRDDKAGGLTVLKPHPLEAELVVEKRSRPNRPIGHFEAPAPGKTFW